jgi:hypothetical protein
MSSLERKAKRNRKKRSTQLTRKQAKVISKGLNNLRLKKGELADNTKNLFDLIALFQITMSDEQIDYYTKNEKFVVVSLDDPNPDPNIKLREGVIYFPMFGLQAGCMINTQGARTTIYLLGNDEKKYLAVNSFLNFFDAEEQLKVTGYYLAVELAAYFNSLNEQLVEEVPPVALNQSIGDINDT